METYRSYLSDDDCRPTGFYPATDGRDAIELVRRGPDDLGEIHTRIERYPAVRVNLKALDVGFNSRRTQHTICLPARSHILVETDDQVYVGWCYTVANQMRADGWHVEIPWT